MLKIKLKTLFKKFIDFTNRHKSLLMTTGAVAILTYMTNKNIKSIKPFFEEYLKQLYWVNNKQHYTDKYERYGIDWTGLCANGKKTKPYQYYNSSGNDTI